MRVKPIEALLSAVLIGVSLLAIVSGEGYFRGLLMPMWVEWLQLGAGLTIPIAAWVLRNPERSKSEKQSLTTSTYICPTCETAVDFRKVGDHTCPKCQTKLEPLEGFYERHPE